MLRKEKLYVNLNKGCFCMEKVNFLGFIVGKNGVQVTSCSKAEGILNLKEKRP